jgi:sugar diacid utilization regulator
VTETSDAGKYSLFGVGGEPRITSWFLACAGREQDWQHELRESVAELVADVALERARLDAGRTGDRKLAEAIVSMLASGAAAGGALVEITSLMRAAGLSPDGRYLVLAISAEAEWMPGSIADRWRCDLAEELAAPLADRTLAAPAGAEIAVLVPLAGDLGQDEAAAQLRAVQPVLEAARIKVTVGISAPVEGAAALSGALHEAGSARRLAALRATAALSVVTSDEVASHELLLASVPASVLRQFRDRLLGPLLAYDERHRAELVPTLREFLACSGSWNACAATMYVHVNTVRYRIRRIEELTGRDLSCLDDQVDFFLAMRVR